MKICPKVSVIIPCFNAENFIACAIESVISQTYTNWEIIICDDCSTDNSVEIIQTFCKLNREIHLLKMPYNTGNPAIPRNLAIENSIGDYIAFLDADDMWLPQKLEQQIYHILKYGYKFVYSNYEKISYSGERKKRNVIVKKKVTYNSLLRSCDIPCLTALFHKSIILNVRFKSIPKEDYVFWLDLFKNTKIIAYNTNEIHALYRESKGSRSSNKLIMLKEQWKILRCYQNLNFVKSLFCISTYLAKAFF
ncbi:MAG: glycosyltransferase family 2 protein [Paludibacteraceae bacterium]|nr:glycosyltransferase family 2 protein [Paludibacteraceae bacterium]